MHRRSLLSGGASALTFAALSSFAAAAPARRPAQPKSAFAALRDRYFLEAMRFNPVTATYLGGDGYSPALADINGALRNYRPEALAREVAFYREIQKANDAVDPKGLTSQERIDHAVLRSQLAFILHQLVDLRYHQRALDTFMAEPFRGVDWQIQQMTDLGSGKLGTAQEWRLVARRVGAIPAYLEQVKGHLRAGVASGNRPDWRMVERDGLSAAASNAEYFRKTLREQAADYLAGQPHKSEVLAALAPVTGAAATAFDEFAVFLRATYPASDRQDRFAIGEREYEWRTRNNLHEPRSAAELFAYGKQQTALYQGKIYEVAQEVARDAGLSLPFGTPQEKYASVRKIMEHLSADSPKSDEELLAWYIDAGKRAVQYGREQRLFDVPADYRLDVVWTPPVLRSTTDASYYPAPPFKKSGVGRFYLTPTGDDPAALRENNRASVADTAVHEGFPGHDWNYKYLNQYAREVSNIRWFTPGAVEDSSSMWEDSPAAEGWGLYAEELMAEPAPGRPHGFYTAGEHLYELQGQLFRAVRVVVDVGIHTGRMSYDEAVDYFAENVSFLPGARGKMAADPAAKAVFENAEKAIYRYSKWPTQAITYNLGKTAIVELREAYRAARGPGFQPKEFHEAFLRMGTIPSALFRDELLAQARAKRGVKA